MKLLMLFFAAVCALPAQVTQPLLGLVRDGQGDLRPIFGTAGNFIVGHPVERGVLATVWNGKGGLAKTATEIIVFDHNLQVSGRHASPEGSASFHLLSSGQPAHVYFPATQVLFTWRNGRPQAEASVTPPHLSEGEIAIEGDQAVVRRTGRRLDLQSEISSVEQMGENWWVLHTATGSSLALLAEPGREQIFELPEASQ